MSAGELRDGKNLRRSFMTNDITCHGGFVPSFVFQRDTLSGNDNLVKTQGHRTDASFLLSVQIPSAT